MSEFTRKWEYEPQLSLYELVKKYEVLTESDGPLTPHELAETHPEGEELLQSDEFQEIYNLLGWPTEENFPPIRRREYETVEDFYQNMRKGFNEETPKGLNNFHMSIRNKPYEPGAEINIGSSTFLYGTTPAIARAYLITPDLFDTIRELSHAKTSHTRDVLSANFVSFSDLLGSEPGLAEASQCLYQIGGRLVTKDDPSIHIDLLNNLAGTKIFKADKAQLLDAHAAFTY